MHPLRILKSRAPLALKSTDKDDPAIETDDRGSVHHRRSSSLDIDAPPAYSGSDFVTGLLHLEEEGRSRSRFFHFGRHRSRSAAASSSKSSPFLLLRRISRLSIETETESVPVTHLATASSRLTTTSEDEIETRNCVEAEAGTEEELRHCDRAVSFSCVHVREYSRILGDHPCCSAGPPLGLGWDVESKTSFDFEDYEKFRATHRQAGPRSEMRVGSEVRRNILLSLTVAAAASPITNTDDDVEGHESTEAPSPANAGETAPRTYLYSLRDLRRAERHLNRDRYEDRYIHERTNGRFFRPIPSPPKDICLKR